MRRRGPAQFAPGASVAACNYFSRAQVRPSHSLWSWELETDRFTSSSCQTNTQAQNYCTFVGFKARNPSISRAPLPTCGNPRPGSASRIGRDRETPYAPTRSCPQSPRWTRMGAVTSRYLVPVISMASRKWTRTSDSRLGRQAVVRPSCVLCRNTVPGCKDPA